MSLRLYAAVISGRPYFSRPEGMKGLGNAVERMQYFEAAVREAREQIKILESQSPSSTAAQYVFLAPEYFFNRNIVGRFFIQDIKRWIVGKLASLSAECPNMLIVPGTVSWTRELSRTGRQSPSERARTVETRIKQNASILRYNIAVGATHTSGAAHVYQFNPNIRGDSKDQTVQIVETKDEQKNVLLARNTAYLCLNQSILKYHKVRTYLEVLSERDPLIFDPGTTAGVFTIGGVRYGLEICADHGDAKNSVLRERVDVHLVISDHIMGQLHGTEHVLIHASTSTKHPSVLLSDKAKQVGEVTKLGKSSIYVLDLEGLSATSSYTMTDSSLGPARSIYAPDAIESSLRSS